MCLAGILTVSFCSAAKAISGDEYLQKLSTEQRAGYYMGVLDGLKWMAALDGEQARSKCIEASFIKRAEAVDELVAILETNPDSPVAGVVKIMIDRKCGAKN